MFYEPFDRHQSISVQRRRAGLHVNRFGIIINSNNISLIRDVLFSLATIAAFSGFRLPVGHLPIFILFVPLIVIANFSSLFNVQLALKAFVLPLFVFMCIHLTSAFRLSLSNGITYVFQAITVSIFVLGFVLRYSSVPMTRYFKLTGFGIVGLMIWVVGFHLKHHYYVGWKRLSDPKIVFDLLPFMLLWMKFTKSKSRLSFSIAYCVFTLLILLSGERKAYIILAVFTPFLINLRSPVLYIGLPILALSVPVAARFEKSGYVSRQLSTLGSFSKGKVEATLSNKERSLAINHAYKFFIHHPIFGIGTNAYTFRVHELELYAAGTHNDWMRVAAENGVFGLFFYSLTVGYGLLGLFRRKSWGRTRTNTEIILSVAVFITFVMYLSFEVYQFLVLLAFCFIPFIQYMWLDPNASSDRLPLNARLARGRPKWHLLETTRSSLRRAVTQRPQEMARQDEQ